MAFSSIPDLHDTSAGSSCCHGKLVVSSLSTLWVTWHDVTSTLPARLVSSPDSRVSRPHRRSFRGRWHLNRDCKRSVLPRPETVWVITVCQIYHTPLGNAVLSHTGHTCNIYVYFVSLARSTQLLIHIIIFAGVPNDYLFIYRHL